MRTLFLGSYGFGNLGDELCLIDAARKFKSSEAWAFSADPIYTQRTTGISNYIKFRSEIGDIKPERIVLGGGGVGFWPSLRDSLHWMRDGLEFGAQLHIHNIGVGTIKSPSWFDDSTVKTVLSKLESFTVRDHVSRWLVLEWGFGLDPGITYYPEVTLDPEPIHFPSIGGRLVGFSITGQSAMMLALEQNRDKIKKFIDDLGDFTAIPIVSTVQDNPDEDDIHGFSVFSEMFLKGKNIGFTEMLDSQWRNEKLTPLKLKFIISKLDLLVSQRKHNVIHAIGSGTRFVGIFPEADDSILRILFSLRHIVPPGSSFLALRGSNYGG